MVCWLISGRKVDFKWNNSLSYIVGIYSHFRSLQIFFQI